MPLKAVLLDRDGVINRDRADYVTHWNQFEFLPGSLEAMRALHAAGLTVVVITNQSAVGRGLLSPEMLEQIHQRLRQAVKQAGGRIAAIHVCPHAPDQGCDCRKPAPGLILRACGELGINASQTIMVGDSARDIRCARQAGCAKAVLVRSGHGMEAIAELRQVGEEPDHLAPDLAGAVQWLLTRRCEWECAS